MNKAGADAIRAGFSSRYCSSDPMTKGPPGMKAIPGGRAWITASVDIRVRRHELAVVTDLDHHLFDVTAETEFSDIFVIDRRPAASPDEHWCKGRAEQGLLEKHATCDVVTDEKPPYSLENPRF